MFFEICRTRRKKRLFLVKLELLSGKRKSSLLDTHFDSKKKFYDIFFWKSENQQLFTCSHLNEHFRGSCKIECQLQNRDFFGTSASFLYKTWEGPAFVLNSILKSIFNRDVCKNPIPSFLYYEITISVSKKTEIWLILSHLDVSWWGPRPKKNVFWDLSDAE